MGVLGILVCSCLNFPGNRELDQSNRFLLFGFCDDALFLSLFILFRMRVVSLVFLACVRDLHPLNIVVSCSPNVEFRISTFHYTF